MAIFGTILLLIFAMMLKWGQTMNKQQEASMLCFQKALSKAYYGYGGGSGFGGASYKILDFTRSVGPFDKYYTSSQRDLVSAGNNVLWDPDLLNADGSGSITYYNIDGQEHPLGSESKIWDTVIETETYTDDLYLAQKADVSGTEDKTRGNIYEDRRIIFRVEEGQEEIEPIETREHYDTNETWKTIW